MNRISATTDGSFGPAMRKLTVRERLFVCMLFEDAATTATKAAELAGIPSETRNGLRTKACRLMQDPKIKEAMIEESQRRKVIMLPKLERALSNLVDTPQHPDHFKAVKLGHELAGAVLPKETNVNVAVTMTEREKEAQIRVWATNMKMDPAKVLGYTPEEPMTTDAVFEEVEDWEMVDVSELE